MISLPVIQQSIITHQRFFRSIPGFPQLVCRIPGRSAEFRQTSLREKTRPMRLLTRIEMQMYLLKD
jgi:hypothetical protein